MTRWRLVCAVWCAAAALAVAQPQYTNVQPDPRGDAMPRRADLGADGPIDPTAHGLPDMTGFAIGPWRPHLPADSLFVGQWAQDGEFFRLDIQFDGLVNPPGPLGLPGDPFNPHLFGTSPLYGFVEIDVDRNMATGGEIAAPQFRYLGNVARWGGLARPPRFRGRIAENANAFDNDLTTPPFVERSGEEFHLVLLGITGQNVGIVRSDESDWKFGPGETWVLRGKFFHRAHAYERFSFACCQAPLGSYEPIVQVQFAHHLPPDRTTVSLVYPLTNRASAVTAGSTGVEPLDGDASNQNSIEEAIDDLVFSATFATADDRADPAFALIAPWEFQAGDVHLDPLTWELTFLFGTSYLVQLADAPLVWTDLWPNVVNGDFNGDGRVTLADLGLLDTFLGAADGSATFDADGTVDGIVRIPDFGPNFSVFDVDYDGQVGPADRMRVLSHLSNPADFDKDGDVDGTDFAFLQRCLRNNTSGVPSAGCFAADLNNDEHVDANDVALFMSCVRGPAIPAGLSCADPVPTDAD